MSGTFEWNIEGQLLQKMLDAKNTVKFESEGFKIRNIPFCLEVYPNGNDKQSIGSFLIFTKINHWPNGMKSMKIRQFYYCTQTLMSVSYVNLYNSDDTSCGTTHRKILLSQLRSMGSNLACLNIGVTIDILQFNIAKDAIFYETVHRQLETPLTIKYQKKNRIVWKISSQLMQSWKSAHFGKCYQSHTVNDMWQIKCYPNGANQQTQGYLSVYILLCAPPLGIETLTAKYRTKCLENDVQHADKKDSLSVWGNDKFMKSTELNRYSTITLTADIEIIEQG